MGNRPHVILVDHSNPYFLLPQFFGNISRIPSCSGDIEEYKITLRGGIDFHTING